MEIINIPVEILVNAGETATNRRRPKKLIIYHHGGFYVGTNYELLTMKVFPYNSTSGSYFSNRIAAS